MLRKFRINEAESKKLYQIFDFGVVKTRKFFFIIWYEVMLMDGKLHNEGDLYKTIKVDGIVFTLKYGFYSETERETGWPIPILPDFLNAPIYTRDGFPLATRIQDSCEHYCAKNEKGDYWCGDCKHFSNPKEDVGICLCEKRRIKRP